MLAAIRAALGPPHARPTRRQTRKNWNKTDDPFPC